MASSSFLASHHSTFCKAGALLTKQCGVVSQVRSSAKWGAIQRAGLSCKRISTTDKVGDYCTAAPSFISPCSYSLRSSLVGGCNQDHIGASTSYRSNEGPYCRCLRSERACLQRQHVRTFAVADGTAEGAVEALEQEHYTLTTPLYYANAAPHMGSAYPTFAADALARFQRLQGKKVVFITGTDEHGEKIATSAAAAGKEPKEFVDAIAEEYKSLWHELDISYDSFIRTTNDAHEKLVAETIQRVWDKGDIYRAEYEGLYCVACEEYKDEKDLLGTEEDGSGERIVCPTHRKPCQHRQEDNYFFKLSNYQADIERLFETNPDFVRPTFRKNEVLEWVKDGVRDFSISRAAVEWGIRIPADPKQTVYVWFDALLGYLSALLKEGDEPTLDNAVARGWPASVHIIGKDILRFHAVYWPGMLLSAGLPLPAGVFGHGFLTKDGLKMGKSLGNVIEPKALVARYGSDAVRYFFLKEVEFGKDGDFSEERFINIVNANLANAIGNLLNRTLGLLKKNCGGVLPADAASLPEDHPLRLIADNAVRKAADEYTNLQFGAAGEAALSIAVAGNEYIDTVAPWSQFKKGDAEKEQAALDLLAILEASRILAVTLSPIAPRVTQRIYQQLGYSEEEWSALSWADTTWGKLRAGQPMAEPKPVFVRLEASESATEAPKTKPAKAPKKQKNEKKPAVVAT